LAGPDGSQGGLVVEQAAAGDVHQQGARPHRGDGAGAHGRRLPCAVAGGDDHAYPWYGPVDGIGAGAELLDEPGRAVLDHLRGNRRRDGDDVHGRTAVNPGRPKTTVTG
jgi:hypothetical protein